MNETKYIKTKCFKTKSNKKDLIKYSFLEILKKLCLLNYQCDYIKYKHF